MASDKKFVEFVLGQIENEGQISFKMMLGEYELYINDDASMSFQTN